MLLNRTRKAMAAYDALDDSLTEAIETAEYDDAVDMLKELEQARQAIGIAFAEDTADRNNRADCISMPACPSEWAFLRRLLGDPS